jgi:soluble lytic murein transglycosylase-like protein
MRKLILLLVALLLVACGQGVEPRDSALRLERERPVHIGPAASRARWTEEATAKLYAHNLWNAVSAIGYRVQLNYAAAVAASVEQAATETAAVYTPPSPPSPVPSVGSGDSSRPCGGWESAVAAYSWDTATACAVLVCESQGDPSATGSLGERGLMQLHPVHAGRFEAHGWSFADAYDPSRNLAIAHEIWSEQGWNPWSCASGRG